MSKPTVEAEIAIFWEQIAQHLPKTIERAALGDAKICNAFRAAYPIIRNYFTTAHEAQARKRFIEELFEIQTMGGKDEIHCSCLPYALVTLSGEEGSPESDAMEARLKALRLPHYPPLTTKKYEH